MKTNDEWRRTLVEWHARLETDRGARAELRRAPDVAAVMTLQPYHDLVRRLIELGDGARKPSEDTYIALAVIAGVVSTIRVNVPGKRFPEIMTEGKPIAVKESRFRRLMESQTADDLLRQLRRIVALTNGRAPVGSLSADTVQWVKAMVHPGFAGYQEPTKAIPVQWAKLYYDGI